MSIKLYLLRSISARCPPIRSEPAHANFASLHIPSAQILTSCVVLKDTVLAPGCLEANRRIAVDQNFGDTDAREQRGRSDSQAPSCVCFALRSGSVFAQVS